MHLAVTHWCQLGLESACAAGFKFPSTSSVMSASSPPTFTFTAVSVPALGILCCCPSASQLVVVWGKTGILVVLIMCKKREDLFSEVRFDLGISWCPFELLRSVFFAFFLFLNRVPDVGRC